LSCEPWKRANLDRKEFDDLSKAVAACPLFKEEIAKLNLPDGFEAIVEPWPYGGKYS
jgi:primary-amine oxidase